MQLCKHDLIYCVIILFAHSKSISPRGRHLAGVTQGAAVILIAHPAKQGCFWSVI